MNKYDDFSIDLSNFEAMAKEYNAQIKSNVLKVEQQDVNNENIKSLFNRIEYLKVVVNNLKSHTSNNDILVVLDDTYNKILEQNIFLNNILNGGIFVQNQSQDEFKMFCNNLKIAISTASDVVKVLVKIKDSDIVESDIKPKLTESVNVFLDINNSLVSLFGECRYLRY